MTGTFLNLPEEKRRRIFSAAAQEFGKNGYRPGSLDAVVRIAGISKGGLYEYIKSKEELFLGTVDYCYRSLYGYLQSRLSSSVSLWPAALLDRLEAVAEIAIDYYLSHPAEIGLLVQAGRIEDVDLSARVEAIFHLRFEEMFGDARFPDSFPRERVMDLLRWLLQKTRNVFFSGLQDTKDPQTLKNDYLDEWRFILGVLRKGLKD